jgi:CRISPR-associated protein Cas6
MIDVVFELRGETLPVAYQHALWNELIRLVPELGDDENVGVIPLRAVESKEGMLLPKRSRLVLRLPQELAAIASGLVQQQLNVAGSALQLGSCRTRAMLHYPTLHAQLVTGAEDETVFVREVESALDAMGVVAKLICGQHRTQTVGERSVSGYSLVLHDLNLEDSLRVQYRGLGKERQFGCGIFVPYKVISGLE